MFPIERIGLDLVDYKFSSSKGSLTKNRVKEIRDSLGENHLSELIDCKLVIKDKNLAKERILMAPDIEYESFGEIFQRIDRILEFCENQII